MRGIQLRLAVLLCTCGILAIYRTNSEHYPMHSATAFAERVRVGVPARLCALSRSACLRGRCFKHSSCLTLENTHEAKCEIFRLRAYISSPPVSILKNPDRGPSRACCTATATRYCSAVETKSIITCRSLSTSRIPNPSEAKGKSIDQVRITEANPWVCRAVIRTRFA